MALAHLSGATDEEIKQGMASFRGVDRRFDFKLKNDRIVFLSDYAHHPAGTSAVRLTYKAPQPEAIINEVIFSSRK